MIFRRATPLWMTLSKTKNAVPGFPVRIAIHLGECLKGLLGIDRFHISGNLSDAVVYGINSSNSSQIILFA